MIQSWSTVIIWKYTLDAASKSLINSMSDLSVSKPGSLWFSNRITPSIKVITFQRVEKCDVKILSKLSKFLKKSQHLNRGNFAEFRTLTFNVISLNSLNKIFLSSRARNTSLLIGSIRGFAAMDHWRRFRMEFSSFSIFKTMIRIMSTRGDSIPLHFG